MVFVLSHDRQPLDPTTLQRADHLLKRGRAAVFRRYPFTIILKDRLAAESVTHAHRVKRDPGSKTTGIAVVAEATGRVVWAGELTHRGQAIRDALVRRKASRKGTQTAEEFGHPAIQAQARRPLKDAAAVNATRWTLYRRLVATGLPVEVGTGGRTTFNRMRLGLEKAHWTDAACLGASTPDGLEVRGVQPLLMRATGHGTRQLCRMARYGFPRTSSKAARTVHGFRTGDLVRATVTTGKKAGTYCGRVAVRTSGSFNLTTVGGTVQGLHYRFFTRLHRADGFTYPGGGASSHPGS